MGALQPWHLIILVLVVVLLFGAKRLPDAARSIGKSMKIFKAETKDMRGESGESDTSATDAETRQLTASSSASSSTAAQADDKDQQLADLQRQLNELKSQQPNGTADQAQKNVS
ncbi:Sec-independent protein translocase subunit TatA [Prauserella muralis]|uniref:Sec-independent protein translocase protein TatA n=1 Tax=Prauserella muralis TaxID=588067 RepID=A0A2V4APP9_9PSEU|nr:Sec-independent protein translocase subunit TatA [Prauserella muralis]PXY22448.1 preprotein translocase subunit TatA [Prauserella muralis]TWE28120.1 sec-independent protein translocase protein TatA [Prauserella muralis]